MDTKIVLFAYQDCRSATDQDDPPEGSENLDARFMLSLPTDQLDPSNGSRRVTRKSLHASAAQNLCFFDAAQVGAHLWTDHATPADGDDDSNRQLKMPA